MDLACQDGCGDHPQGRAEHWPPYVAQTLCMYEISQVYSLACEQRWTCSNGGLYLPLNFLTTMAEDKGRQNPVVLHHRVEDGTVRIKNDAIRCLSVTSTGVGQQQDARLATDAEKMMTVRQAIRLYKWAIIYSMAMSVAVVMEG